MHAPFDVIATFDSSSKAEAALDRLLTQGFEPGAVAVMVADRARGRHFAIDAKHQFPEGAALGGAIGGVVGALVSGLAIASGWTAPGLEEIDVGSFIATLAGAGAGGLLGWLIGGLVGLGFHEHEAKLVDNTGMDGHVVLGVRAGDSVEAALAERILEQGGATSVAA